MYTFSRIEDGEIKSQYLCDWSDFDTNIEHISKEFVKSVWILTVLPQLGLPVKALTLDPAPLVETL